MKTIITGGAGYNGSTVAHNFIDKKYNLIIMDNLVNGSKLIFLKIFKEQ